MKQYFLSLVLMSTLVLPVLVEASNYKVTPRIIDREVKQRDIFSETITITNNANHNVNVYASVNEVVVNEGGDITDFAPPSVSDNTITPTSWVSITRGRISLSAGQTKTIPVNVNIHPQAEPGVYHILLGFGTGRNRGVAESQVTSGVAPSVIMTLSVDQERSEFMKLSRFIVDRFVTSSDNDAVTYTLDNPGEAVIVPTGEIIISDSRGAEVGSIPINPDGESLAPGQETTFVVPAPTHDMMGRYKAFLAVDYGTEQLASVYDTAFFYVFPWQRLLLLFVIILLIAVVITIILHRRMVGSVDEIDHEEVPLYMRNSVSEDQDHDINLKIKQ